MFNINAINRRIGKLSDKMQAIDEEMEDWKNEVLRGLVVTTSLKEHLDALGKEYKKLYAEYQLLKD